MAMLTEVVAYVCCCWVWIVILVQLLGIFKLFCYYSSPPSKPVSPRLPQDDVPYVTIIRPVKGLEPRLYDCLASTFDLEYARSKLCICFCVPDPSDPARGILEQLVARFPSFDARIYIETEDPLAPALGPNPKIRNISRAYREAPKDALIWILDCNVWVSPGVAGRMVDKLCGFRHGGLPARPYKFVHQLPLVIDVDDIDESESATVMAALPSGSSPVGGSPLWPTPRGSVSAILSRAGGRLEEMFMATSHAKFYAAINAVGVAPCIMGKSNMFRKDDLEVATATTAKLSPRSAIQAQPSGTDFFSFNICEDHLIGDLLWKTRFPSRPDAYNHGLVFGDVAVQPMAGMSLSSYVARRVRWLRVRKFTVLLATLVEPGVESLLCSAYLAFGLTTAPRIRNLLGLSPVQWASWSAFGLLWLVTVATWMAVDRIVYSRLLAFRAIESGDDTPCFARPAARPRPLSQWIPAWLGRETLALPIWAYAVLLGSTVAWRGKHFRVGFDARVVELGSGQGGSEPPSSKARTAGTPEHQDVATARSRSKEK